MTLVVDGIPSSGGPRCFGTRVDGFFSVVVVAAGAAALVSSVDSVKGNGLVATSVSPAAAAAAAS